ncbi:MAG: hypothetical protein DVB31_17660 [Verrucomicrobia bacterium]|nr:MAG: hypothetical protein DVB31_17660 [Verrucomicrobiota bacterium]
MPALSPTLSDASEALDADAANEQNRAVDLRDRIPSGDPTLPPIHLSPDEVEFIIEQLDEPDPGQGGGDVGGARA